MVIESINQALAAEIEDAKECYGNPPPNEASTCDWVILPLLLAVGYSKRDIVSQAGNGGGGIPDYTVLGDTPNTWYLEAKDWKRSLDKGPDAIQAINYANARGHQWVVLSNGKEWLLFDNHIQGVPDAKLVARAEVNDPGFADFITALGKASVQSGGLEEYAATWRLREVLRVQLLAHDSVVVKAILRVLRAEAGLSYIKGSDVVRYFAALGSRPITADAPETPGSIAVKATIGTDDVHESASRGAGPVDINSLAELREQGDGLNYGKPSEILFPDGTTAVVTNWRFAALAVVIWIGASFGLPAIPFRVSKGAKRCWFLNSSPVHADGTEMKSHTLFQIGGQDVHMNTNQSAVSFTKCLCSLCEACGVPTTDIRIRLVSSGH